MSDSKIPTDDNCPPCNDLLSPPPTRPDCKTSFVFKIHRKYLGPSRDSGIAVPTLRIENMTLEQIKHSCESWRHKEEILRELSEKYNKEIYRALDRQVGKSMSYDFDRIHWCRTVGNLVFEIDMPELLSLVFSGDMEDERCTICLESVPANDRNVLIPCLHTYHVNCLQQWLRTKPECPLCRYTLLPKPHSGLHK